MRNCYSACRLAMGVALMLASAALVVDGACYNKCRSVASGYEASGVNGGCWKYPDEVMELKVWSTDKTGADINASPVDGVEVNQHTCSGCTKEDCSYPVRSSPGVCTFDKKQKQFKCAAGPGS